MGDAGGWQVEIWEYEIGVARFWRARSGLPKRHRQTGTAGRMQPEEHSQKGAARRAQPEVRWFGSGRGHARDRRDQGLRVRVRWRGEQFESGTAFDDTAILEDRGLLAQCRDDAEVV